MKKGIHPENYRLVAFKDMSNNDIFLANVTYFNRISERSAFAASFKYFSLGEIELRENEFDLGIIEKPNEIFL